MPTRPVQTSQATLADARKVLGAAKKAFSKFAAADKNKQAKSLPASVLTRLAANIDLLDTARGAAAAGKASVASATSAEDAAREKVYDLIIDIRNDVKLGYPDDKKIARAFGSGTKLGKTVTDPLLAAATAVIGAYESAADDFGKRAKAAGVTAARITQLKKAREALSAADATQGARIGERRSTNVDKKALLVAVKKDVAHIRQAAAALFRKDPKSLAAFASVVARRARKTRPTKPAPPAPTPAPTPAD
jgi:hypothetical protein